MSEVRVQRVVIKPMRPLPLCDKCGFKHALNSYICRLLQGLRRESDEQAVRRALERSVWWKG